MSSFPLTGLVAVAGWGCATEPSRAHGPTNSSVSERTKHVDLRAHFVRDMIKDQVIEINFVKSAENDSDIMTKNQQEQHYMYAKSKLVYTVQEMNEKKDIQDEEIGRMLES